ncbi:hypothetical protein, partial [Alistipes ihumii]
MARLAQGQYRPERSVCLRAHVKVGQKIGEFHGLGAPIHASVSGTVKAVE